jgi:hypothetical protein
MCCGCFPFSDVEYEGDTHRRQQRQQRRQASYRYTWNGQAWVLQPTVRGIFPFLIRPAIRCPHVLHTSPDINVLSEPPAKPFTWPTHLWMDGRDVRLAVLRGPKIGANVGSPGLFPWDRRSEYRIQVDYFMIGSPGPSVILQKPAAGLEEPGRQSSQVSDYKGMVLTLALRISSSTGILRLGSGRGFSFMKP